MFIATSLITLVNGVIVEELEAPAPVDCSGMSALFEPTIPKFGSDCTAWAELFAPGGKYYHAHAGFHTGANLESACTGYASFCPWTAGKPLLNQPAKSACKFDISGAAQIVSMNGKCHALVPYIWAQDPAQSDNLEPHTGWEYMMAENIKGSWKLKRFCEIETTFSVPFNWVTPNATDETWKLEALKTSQANKGECNNPIQPLLTSYFQTLSSTTETKALFRQQGNAVALPAGGLCQLVVPYAAMVNGKNTEGKKVFTLEPSKGSYKMVTDVVTFTSYTQPAPAPTCQAAHLGQCNSLPCCKGMSSMSTLGGCFCNAARSTTLA